jgi:molybdopterin-dependent oxidoreductase alpha subunit
MAVRPSNDSWLSHLVAPGIAGQTEPHPYREMATVLWENKRELSYAWKILTHGVCDGCSLGPYGLRDNVLSGIHLCMTRLKLLRLNTMGPLDLSILGHVSKLKRLNQDQLSSLGRLPYPMIRRHNAEGFLRVSWNEALDLVCKEIHDASPQEMGFFAASRRLTNEVYYVLQKLARTLGTNNVDLCSRLCDAANMGGLKKTLGLAAPTCSLSDFIGTDLLVVFGCDPADKQPVTAKYMHYAKKLGTRIFVVNPMPEFGLKREWVPWVTRSARFGTKLMDDFFQVRAGGDIAFINGVLKALIAFNRIDEEFIATHTEGFQAVKTALQEQSWEMLEARSGLTRTDMERFAQAYGSAKTAVFVYTMDLTQHEFGMDHVKAVVNLALARGMLGREKCGIMPMRGDSGAQGGEECGSDPDKFPGGFPVDDENARRISNLWRHPVPSVPGLKAPEMIEAAYRGKLKFLYSIGTNLVETMADDNFVSDALKNIRFRIHQDIVLNRSMLLDGAEAVLILPSQTRYEQRSGGTSTSTERRIRFTPEVPGHHIGEAQADWEIPVLIGRRAMPNGDLLFPFKDTRSIREEMARVMPIYQGIEKLNHEGDHLQWGGPSLFKNGFSNMPSRHALFTVFTPPDRSVPAGTF